MKIKSHSGLKKRVKIRKSGKVMMQKPCRKHLLSDKSKSQKKSFRSGFPLHKTQLKAVRRLLSGKVNLRANLKRVVKKEEKAEEKK